MKSEEYLANYKLRTDKILIYTYGLVSLRYCNMEGHEVLTALVKIRNA